MVSVRILAYNQRELDVLQSRQQRGSPGDGALRPWWQVTGLPGPWITEAHRHERNPSFIVEHISRDTQPVAEPFSTRIIEWKSGIVNPAARCLSCNEYAGGLVHLDDRAGAERQVIGADRARPDLDKQ